MFRLVQIAQAASDTPGVAEAQRLVGKINGAILFPLIALMMAIAFVVFLYGAFEYVKNANNDTARETGRNHLMYGVIGMLVMLSAMAILQIAAGTFGLQNELDNATRPESSPFALDTSIRPIARPVRSPTPTLSTEDYSSIMGGSGGEDTGGDTPPSQTTCYSLGGCGPSPEADPFDAFREEIRYSGGRILGSPRMWLVESGEVSMALSQIDEYYRFHYITPETRDRLIIAVQADAPNRPGYKAPDPVLDSIEIKTNKPITSLVQSTPTENKATDGTLQYMDDELISNGMAPVLAGEITSALLLTSSNESSIRVTLDGYVSMKYISVATRDRVLQQFGY